MAHNEIHVAAPPEAVFAVLSDPRSFARWVVGSREIRAADPGWPAPGTTFDHAVGAGPFLLSDSTTVQTSEPPHLLRMLVRARPLTQAIVTLQIQPEAGGSRIVMDERAADRRSLILFNPLGEPLVRVRNAESLRRLRRLAEGAEQIPGGALPPRGAATDAAITGSSAPASV